MTDNVIPLRSSCDTLDGIAAYLGSLEGLHKLANDRSTLNKSWNKRREAGEKDVPRLNEFIVLGRYMFDTCANFSPITEGIPAELMDDCPLVMTTEQYWTGHKTKSMTTSYSRGCAYPGIKCPHCKKTWTIDNCHDVYINDKSQTAYLHSWVGKTLAEFAEQLATRTEARWCLFYGDRPLKNVKYLDTSPHPKIDGWMANDDGRVDTDATHVIEKNDEVRVVVFKQHHTQCWIDRQNAREFGDFTEIFAAAGFKKFNLEPIPNQYWPKGSRFDPPDWYKVDTHMGEFTIGWRKRVIELTVSDQAIERCGSLDEFFKAEDVTKSRGYIHAYGTDKAIEYLMRINERNREEGQRLSTLPPKHKRRA